MAGLVDDPIKKLSMQDLTTELQAVTLRVKKMRDDLPKDVDRGVALLREMDRRCDFATFGFVSTFAPQLVEEPEPNVIAFPTEAPMQPHPSFVDTNFEEPARPFTELPGASLCTTAGHGAEGEVEDSAPDAAPSAAPHDGYTNGATDA